VLPHVEKLNDEWVGADIQKRERFLAKASKVGIGRTTANPHNLGRAQIPRPGTLDKVDLSHAALPHEKPHDVLIAEDISGRVWPLHDARLGLLRGFGANASAEEILK